MTGILNLVNVGTLETCPTHFLFPFSAVSLGMSGLFPTTQRRVDNDDFAC